MSESQTVHAFVAALDGEALKKFLASYGGGDDPFSTVLASLENPKNERAARDKIEKLFGVRLTTAAERQEEITRRSADATVRQAEAAQEANRLAHQANEIAAHANHTAKRAFGVSWWNMLATAVATIIACFAMIVSLVR